MKTPGQTHADEAARAVERGKQLLSAAARRVDDPDSNLTAHDAEAMLSAAQLTFAAAQVHATLAVASELAAIRDRLGDR